MISSGVDNNDRCLFNHTFATDCLCIMLNLTSKSEVKAVVHGEYPNPQGASLGNTAVKYSVQVTEPLTTTCTVLF